jgi:hypothetical protein
MKVTPSRERPVLGLYALVVETCGRIWWMAHYSTW